MSSRNRIVMAMAAAGLVLAGPALAAEGDADARIRELEKKLERSLQMIEALQTKVQQMQPAAPQSAAPAASMEQAAKIDALEKQVAQLGSGLSSRGNADEGVALHGFADVGLRRSAEDNAVYGKGKKGFDVGGFDMYLTPNLGGNVRTLIEMNTEVDQGGTVGVDLERLQGGYTFSDALTTWIGRFHTPYGYWNTAFHHGAQIQTAVTRPRFLGFEDQGGILPAHTTGLWATGVLDSASAKFGYDAYVGNAPRILSTGNADNTAVTNAGLAKAGQYAGQVDMKQAGWGTNQSSAGFNAWLSPKSLSSLRVGIHGLQANVDIETDGSQGSAASGPIGTTRLSMLGAYGAFIDDNWEILAEYYRFNDQNLTNNGALGSLAGPVDGAKRTSSAWYTQIGYNIGQFTPYGRVEKASLDQKDNYFAANLNGRSYSRGVLGLRYDVNPKSALKFEVNRTRRSDLVDANGNPAADNNFSEAYVQFAVRF